MKPPRWLTRRRVIVGCCFAVGLTGVIAVVDGLRTGQIKAGFGADTTITKSEKTDKQGNVIERITTTTFQDAKTLWDWLSLLGVPLSLALLAWWLQRLQQEKTNRQEKLEKEIAEVNQREEILQAYFDRVSTLLVEKNLLALAAKARESSATEENQQDLLVNEQKELLDVSVDIIRARTLSILRRLENDGERKGSLIRFLSEADIFKKLDLHLSAANLIEAKLNNVDLGSVNLSSENYSGSVNLGNADLTGANFKSANLSYAFLFRACLGSADFSNANLLGSRCSSTSLDYTNFSNANLSGTGFGNAHGSYANFSNANLNYANFEDAILGHSDLKGSNMSYATLKRASFPLSNLSHANLSHANFSNAVLVSANLSYANLTGAILYSANLSYANLNKSLLLATDLRRTTGLTKEQLEGANAPILCGVALPEELSSSVDPNRNCDSLPHVLLALEPDVYKTYEAAKAFVDEARQKEWD